MAVSLRLGELLRDNCSLSRALFTVGECLENAVIHSVSTDYIFLLLLIMAGIVVT
jgi:hypothetical protein